MMIFHKCAFLFSFALVVLSTKSYGAQSYHYPELLVVPKATSTLVREAKSERSDGMTRYLSIQSSALTTILVGLRAKGDEKDGLASDSGKMGIVALGAGSLLLGLTSAVSMMTTPYQDGVRDVKRIKTKGRVGQLEKERIAEEALNDAGGIARNLSLLSVAVNFSLNVAIAGGTDDRFLQGAAGLGAIVSLVPYFFEARAETVMKRHQDYKKRIYGPVTSLGFFRSGPDSKIGPMMSMTYPL